ncbi:arylacetamide deacetylase-like isoform X4 [Suncus etruscus]|uniref:arylacetamide deacetylase-like isoform X4 n=1 Tax=Suncus etruscus TaxID=109475 RepID=UPI00210F3E2C|nr:arylacetamide deacetylase-like isoform X4 [Suncus etruscus]
MGRKVILFLIVGVFGAWYLCTPLPANTEQPWAIMCVEACLKTISKLMHLVELLGISHYMTGTNFILSFLDIPPTSDEYVTVVDTTFDNISVRVYVPTQKTKTLRRGIFYIHGGGFSLGSAGFYCYDNLSRRTAHRLNAVVISTNYRLAPKHHFPDQFEDVYNALRWFLRQAVLQEYGVDPKRIGVSGDSSGGNSAAAVVQQLRRDQDVKVKIKVQSLIYPALQALDFGLPSYRENAHSPILNRKLAIRLVSEYATTDRSLEKAMSINQHVPAHSAHLLQFVNWSSLLPERFQKGHIYKKPAFGSSTLAKKYPGFLDVRAAPLLADDTQLRSLPQTYVLTCQHDVLRDDGVMYVTRLRNAGVPVTHDHIEDGFHGLISNSLKVGDRMRNQYINWLSENL